MKKISVVIITKNEERKIRDCLESVKWADEIVVVDQFSSDNTVRICKEYTNNVYQQEFKGFSAQKHSAVEKAANEWIFNIDADERVTPELRTEISGIINSDTYDGIAVYRPTVFLGRTLKFRGWGEPPILRVFKKSHGQFKSERFDAPLAFEGKIYVAENVLLHKTEDVGISDYMDKFNQHTSHEVGDLIERGVVIRPGNYFWYFFLKPFLVFLHGFFIKKGFTRGFPGFFWYLFRAFNGYFVTYAKLWEWQLNNRDKRS